MPDTIKFLVVDDVEQSLDALEALLKRDDLEIVRTRSGEEALEQLLQHDFALALLDVHMHGMDGFELAELMRGTARTSHIPIIFVTGNSEENRRFRGYEAGAVDYLQKPIDPIVLKNKASVFFELYRQRREVARQRDELKLTAERLTEALARLNAHDDNSLMAIVELNSSFEIVSWSKGAERIFGWKATNILGRNASELEWFTDRSWSDLRVLFSEMVAGETLRDLRTVSLRRIDGVERECEWYTSALFDSKSRLLSVNAHIIDVTERQKAQETQQLLVGELNHRVKNTLATVQAIANQTLRHAKSPGEFTTTFSGRIQSMSRAHDLLSNATWRGAKLITLIQDQIRLGADSEPRLVISGPDVYLAPQLAMHLALILHELGTNARKYGALSTPTGIVTLSWSTTEQRLILCWSEKGGPPVTTPRHTGFGTSLIRKTIEGSGGTAIPTYRDQGIIWTIDVPLPHIPPIESPALSEALPRAPSYLKGAIARKRILVVEDEPVLSLELATLLEEANAIVIGPVSSTEQALAAIDKSSVDGALLDGNLQGRPVDAIADELLKRNMPFIFVTGYTSISLRTDLAAKPVLTKPFTHDQLLAAVTSMFDKEDRKRSGTA